MIEIRALHSYLGGRAVLRGVDLRIATGEAVAIIGPSGTGKSVLLKHVIGLLEPDAGDVLIDGRSIGRARYRELADVRAAMGYVFQDGALLDSLTVRQNLRLALSDERCAHDHDFADERITESLAAVNLPVRVLEQLPAELSGGMRKRVGVARAIINSPRVILYDEPTTGLDPANARAINELIRSTHRRLGATTVVVSHELTALERIADRVILLDSGVVCFDGTPAELFATSNPGVAAFTGRTHSMEQPWPATLAVATH
jgi:phospholipid/cholesterol/gamma-HCH transport system ATP-binding protein